MIKSLLSLKKIAEAVHEEIQNEISRIVGEFKQTALMFHRISPSL